jgi:hypothetical protein
MNLSVTSVTGHANACIAIIYGVTLTGSSGQVSKKDRVTEKLLRFEGRSFPQNKAGSISEQRRSKL